MAGRFATVRFVRLNPGWPLGPGSRLKSTSLRVDELNGGALRIAGTVAIDDTPDVPVGRQVRLFDKRSARLVRQVWSDPVSGAYEFNGLRDGEYFAVSHDHTREYNAAIKDAVSPEPAP